MNHSSISLKLTQSQEDLTWNNTCFLQKKRERQIYGQNFGQKQLKCSSLVWHKCRTLRQKNTSMLSPISLPATGIVPRLCPFLRHNDIFLSSPALATTKSITIAPQFRYIQMQLRVEHLNTRIKTNMINQTKLGPVGW